MEKTNDKILERIIFGTTIIGWVIYNIRRDFNVSFFTNLGHSIIEYKYRILFVILINLLIIIGITIPYKKPRIIHICLHSRGLIIFILCLLYPFTNDFKNRFGIISSTNVSDFYAIFLPIFIMLFFYATSPKPGHYKPDPEEKDKIKSTLSKNLAPYKKNKNSNFVFIILFSLLFALLTLWIDFIGKVSPNYQELFIKYPIIIFAVLITVSGNIAALKKDEEITKNSIKSSVKSKKRKNKYENTPSIKEKLK